MLLLDLHLQHEVSQLNTLLPCCRDELRAAWAAFTPLLHAIDRGEAEPLPYPAGSRGPPASDVLVSKAGFVKNANYLWRAGSGATGDIS